LTVKVEEEGEGIGGEEERGEGRREEREESLRLTLIYIP
jgi:hypothetical protein